MRILMAGGTGFLGQELGIALSAAGHELIVMSRHPEQYRGELAFPAELVGWQPGFRIPSAVLTSIDAVINLTGASVASTSWNTKGKEMLRSSRVDPAAGILTSLSELQGPKPMTYIQASATGYYGDAGEQTLTEDAPPGEGYLARLCVDWELTARDNCPSDVRLVLIRIPPVLGLAQGILKTLDKAYAPGIAPKLGTGRQWFSWIHIRDLVSVFSTALDDKQITGPLNAVSPEPVRFSDFHSQMAKVKGVVDFGRVPEPALRLLQGEKSSLVLNSVRALPARLETFGFSFHFPELRAALADIYAGAKGCNSFWLESKQWIPKPPAEVWPFFSTANNLEKLTPKWLSFTVLRTSTDQMRTGTKIDYQLKLRGIPLRWRSEILTWSPNEKFIDHQTRGPYKLWHHTHAFKPLAAGTLMIDTVQFELPFRPFGLLGMPMVMKDVHQIFEFRKQRVKEEFGVINYCHASE